MEVICALTVGETPTSPGLITVPDALTEEVTSPFDTSVEVVVALAVAG